MKNVLVLCTGNSCRSQMAEGYLKKFAKNKARIYSAGIEVHGLNPKAVQTMADDEIDISKHTSNRIDEYNSIGFDYIITVCDLAKESCPYFPSKAIRFHRDFTDPAKAIGSEEELKIIFESARNQIRRYCKEFTSAYL